MRDRDALHDFRKLSFKRKLRNNMTPAEHVLWEELRNRNLRGTEWRRQANIHTFIADFLYPEYRLIVEVDGGIHETQKEYDSLRTGIISERGYCVIRFSNREILGDVQSVLKKIQEAIYT